jgi:hypothetical protein
VLYNIYEHLPLVDKGCLSLSCKRLFDLFGAILKEKESEYPRLARFYLTLLCVSSHKAARNQLLVRLQSRSWKYCGMYLKLHPRRGFSKRSLADPALRRSCAKHIGSGYLCPCVSLTTRELGHIVKLLKSPTPLSQTKVGPFKFDLTSETQPGAYISAGFHVDRDHLSHYCSLPTASDYKAMVNMIRISIDSSDYLEILARYTIFCSSSFVSLRTTVRIPLSLLEPYF